MSETLGLVAAVLTSLLTLMMSVGLKVIFDMRGQLSESLTHSRGHERRLDEHATRLDRHDARWDALPQMLKDDRHDLRNWVTAEVTGVEVELKTAQAKLAHLESRIGILENVTQARQ